ncbi:hypothetical protein D9757_009173 [Collybiopsis confluens]|uniref:Alpha/beta hydrolase fold-3 domain-containing protein n=1 Tax=Collybiopsis confluens TaxID=2823264 RepID=A0A8H5M2B4_9AGAR|nr:hypothetical protein D9757_009173 [Collybiopsis confluens]
MDYHCITIDIHRTIPETCPELSEGEDDDASPANGGAGTDCGFVFSGTSTRGRRILSFLVTFHIRIEERDLEFGDINRMEFGDINPHVLPCAHTLNMATLTYSDKPILDESKYAAVSWRQALWMKVKVNLLPLVVLNEILLSPFVSRSKDKPLKRVKGDGSFRYLTDVLPGPQVQLLMGSSVSVYSNWATTHHLPILIDELEDGGKLFWIGPKRTEKMLLYCHGGAFIFPVQDWTISFWRYIQLELEKRGIYVGVAIMSYSLIPVSDFPTPLRQTCQALNHLLTVEKVKPSNLQLVGDSAGGNLVSQVLSTMLHPLFSPPIIPPERNSEERI